LKSSDDGDRSRRGVRNNRLDGDRNRRQRVRVEKNDGVAEVARVVQRGKRRQRNARRGRFVAQLGQKRGRGGEIDVENSARIVKIARIVQNAPGVFAADASQRRIDAKIGVVVNGNIGKLAVVRRVRPSAQRFNGVGGGSRVGDATQTALLRGVGSRETTARVENSSATDAKRLRRIGSTLGRSQKFDDGSVGGGLRSRRIERNENAFAAPRDDVSGGRRNGTRRDETFALRRSPLSLDRDDAKKSEKRADRSDRRRRSPCSSKICQTAYSAPDVPIPPLFAPQNQTLFIIKTKNVV